MPLDFPAPPKESLACLSEGLSKLPPSNKYAFMTPSAGGEQPTVSLANEVFVLNPEDIREGKNLDSSQSTSWRYVLDQRNPMFGTPATATAEVVYEGGKHIFSSLQHGWLGNATREAVDIALKLPAVQNGNFELRMLRMPAIRVDSLWLKDKSAGGDIVVPIRSAVETIKAFQACDAEDFRSRILEFLEKEEPFDNSPVSSNPSE